MIASWFLVLSFYSYNGGYATTVPAWSQEACVKAGQSILSERASATIVCVNGVTGEVVPVERGF